ncbi:hypothetical protein CSPX01_06316 [Colletotrichum filicis]|nr:hypothetical protein CSPX01_06316 [Colletotrichum filicis]
MDSHSNRVTNKRGLEDDDDAAPAGENRGHSPGVRNNAFRTQTIEVDYSALDGEAGGSTKLEIWVTDIQGVECRVGEIWDVESYERAGKVKAIAKKRGTSERASSTPMDKFGGEDLETARRELEGRQEEMARQEEAADQEERTRQQEKAQQEENRVLRGGREARQEKKALREEKKAQREVKKAVVEKSKALREKQKAADDLQTRKQKKIKAHPEKKATKEKRGIRENEKALQKKKKMLRDKQKALREKRNALQDKKKTRQSMSTERLRSG